MEGKVNIPDKIIEWLSMSVNGIPNWGASTEGLRVWFLTQWKSTDGNISNRGFKQLKLENIKLAFELYGRIDLYQSLTQYFSDKGQINDINGVNYISEDSFLNLEDKYKAILDQGVAMDEEEEPCSYMFNNNNEQLLFYMDEIRSLLSNSYTLKRHDTLKGLLSEISKELKKCSKKGVNVEHVIVKFNDLNKRYKEWVELNKPKAKSTAKSKAKSTAKSKAKSTAKSTAKSKSPKPRNICSEEESWYRNFSDNIFAIETSLRKPCNDVNQPKLENRINDLKNYIIRCRDDMPEGGIKDRVFAFNELYYKFVEWLNGRRMVKKINPIIAPNSYKCDETRGLCIPTGERDHQTKTDCTSSCVQIQQHSDELPAKFYRNGHLLSPRDLFNSFEVSGNPTKKDIIRILKILYPGIPPGVAMNKEGAKRLFECRDALQEGAMKKRKPKSRTKRRNYDKKKKKKKKKASRTKHR
jgi:hypothetical protein